MTYISLNLNFRRKRSIWYNPSFTL